jgi:hypothetical protein
MYQTINEINHNNEHIFPSYDQQLYPANNLKYFMIPVSQPVVKPPQKAPELINYENYNS